jgi:hypothetical protein
VSNYWDEYSLKEKLWELGELSARRNRLMLDVIRELPRDKNEDILKIMSGEIVNVIDLSDFCEKVIS